MNITEYIIAYLRQGKTVELPGIGSLASKQVTAHYNSVDDTFTPSHDTLTFDRYTRGDKSIVRYIAEQECIDERTAERMFRNYMEVLQEKLDKEHCHHFPGIGLLRKEESLISFEPEAVMPSTEAIPARPTLTGVKTYNHAAHDPFAQFEQEFQDPYPAKEEVKEEPTPVEIEEENVIAETEATGSKDVADEWAVAEQALHNLKTQLTQPDARIPQEDYTYDEKFDEESFTHQDAVAEESSNEEPGEHNEGNVETPVFNSTQDALSSLQEMEKLTPATGGTSHNNNKRRPWRLILILLVLILLGGAAYYFFALRNSDTTITLTEEDFVMVEEDDEMVMEEETSASNGMALINNDFTLSTDDIDYTAADVTRLSNAIGNYLADYIRNYAIRQRYSQAAGPLQQKVLQYAEVRLSEILSNKPFSVMEFFNFCENDYMHIYYGKDLKLGHSSRQRITVQREVMSEALLYRLLQEVIDETGITADAAPAPQPKYVAPPAAAQDVSKQGFDIIAGFYVNRTSADKMANDLKKKGCDAYIINKDGYYYVSMGSAGSQTAAEALYRHIKEWYKGDIAIKKW